MAENLLSKQHRYSKQELELDINSVQYKAVLELIDFKVKITMLMQSFSPVKWSEEFSLEQLQEYCPFFKACETIEKSFESLPLFLKNNDLTTSHTDQAMILNINLNQIIPGCTAELLLSQTEVNTSEAFILLNKQILNLEQKVKELSTKIEENEEEISLLKQQQDSSQRISQTYLLPNEKDRSSILLREDYLLLEKWINNGAKKIHFQILYRATVDGFQLSNLYQKCAGETSLLVLIKSTSNRRFGFYTDKDIKATNAWVPQNPNNIFIFSLYESKRYNSNEKNCPQAFYGDANQFTIGAGSDLRLYNDSNKNENSCNNPGSYGKNEGIESTYYLSGSKQFKTEEVEIFHLVSS